MLVAVCVARAELHLLEEAVVQEVVGHVATERPLMPAAMLLMIHRRPEESVARIAEIFLVGRILQLWRGARPESERKRLVRRGGRVFVSAHGLLTRARTT